MMTIEEETDTTMSTTTPFPDLADVADAVSQLTHEVGELTQAIGKLASIAERLTSAVESVMPPPAREPRV
jgi:hypothetical protein